MGKNMFDGFEYCGAWYKNMPINFANKTSDVDVQIYGYDEENGVGVRLVGDVVDEVGTQDIAM